MLITEGLFYAMLQVTLHAIFLDKMT